VNDQNSGQNTRALFNAGNLKNSLVAALLTLLCSGSSLADDSEVFFGQVDRSKDSQPNLLFILDTSVSMQDPAGNPRLTRLKTAMKNILNTADNVNIGLMRMNGWAGGGGILYPVTSISDRVCESNECDDIEIASQVDSADDDIEEKHDKTTDMSSTVLELGDVLPNSYDNHMIGLRFNNVSVPHKAEIVSATISFHATADTPDPGPGDAVPLLWARASKETDAEAFTTAQGTASARDLTSAVSWYPDGDPSTDGIQGWRKDQRYETDDLTDTIKDVVEHSDWCGGNSIMILLGGEGNFKAHSYESNPAFAPTLNITYASDSIDEEDGCATKTIVSRVAGRRDDAEEKEGRNTDIWSPDLELFNDNGVNQRIGMRFNDILLPRKAEIRNAYLVLEMDNETSYGDVKASIWGQNSDNPTVFLDAWKNIINRPRTSAKVDWNIEELAPSTGEWRSPDLKEIIEEISERGGWNPGNSIVLIMENAGGSGLRDAKANDRSPATAPKLVINYIERVSEEEAEQSYITAREHLLNTIDNMKANGNTPLVDVLYEAGLYYRGKPVELGKKRGIHTSLDGVHRVAHPLSYTGGYIHQPEGSCSRESNNWNCRFEEIRGNPVYKSPMTSQCQTNHIVLLSDGKAYSNEAWQKIQALTNVTECDPSQNEHEKCGYELIEYYKNSDFSSLPKQQNITVHTIGFDLEYIFLEKLAQKSGGRYYEASSSLELLNTFKTIINDVYSVDTSFVAPGATVNQFNRLTHRNDIYFALFKPVARPTWSGNLRRLFRCWCEKFLEQ